MSERAAFQSCLSAFMVLVEDAEKLEEEEEEEDSSSSEGVGKSNDNFLDLVESSSEGFRSARASFGSCLEDKGRE